MIFNTETTPAINMEAVEPSKYEVGLEGALMHVYETECNYNALMKAAGLSELKYFKETGGDLFVNEAGAFKGFIAKAKAMFKAVIDKIVAMFKRFFMAINSFVRDDKTFVSKYRDTILRRQDSIDNFEFKGYDFGNLDSKVAKLDLTEPADIGVDANAPREKFNRQFDNAARRDGSRDLAKASEDDMVTYINTSRGYILGDGSAVDESEFKKELKNRLYGNDGDKTTLEKISLSDQITIISNTNENIKTTKKSQDTVISTINKMIKKLENYETDTGKKINDKNSKEINTKIKLANVTIRAYKAKSADLTTAFGMIIQAYKDRNRQAKAICVKAMSYKDKDAGVKKGFEESVAYDVDDIFAGVAIQ